MLYFSHTTSPNRTSDFQYTNLLETLESIFFLQIMPSNIHQTRINSTSMSGYGLPSSSHILIQANPQISLTEVAKMPPFLKALSVTATTIAVLGDSSVHVFVVALATLFAIFKADDTEQNLLPKTHLLASRSSLNEHGKITISTQLL